MGSAQERSSRSVLACPAREAATLTLAEQELPALPHDGDESGHPDQHLASIPRDHERATSRCPSEFTGHTPRPSAEPSDQRSC